MKHNLYHLYSSNCVSKKYKTTYLNKVKQKELFDDEDHIHESGNSKASEKHKVVLNMTNKTYRKKELRPKFHTCFLHIFVNYI